MRLRRQLFHLDVLAGCVGLALVAVSVVGMGDASGATAVSDGSDWGAQGELSSVTAQTARWDNTGNATASTVPRDASQTIPHTGGKTYADVAAADQTAYASHFGTDDGFGGLQVSVSQTDNLVNQAVTVSFSGADPDIPGGAGSGQNSNSYFQVFQCWGAEGSNGQPDPTATAPDPNTCQVGAPGPDSIGGSSKRELRIVAGDPLVPGGDWAQYDDTSQYVEVPFQSITGEQSGSNLDNQNTFFNRATTNEYSHIPLPSSGVTSRQFEMQTGVESQGLGCGARTDAPSTSTCWLVVVPRIQDIDESQGPTSPSVWAQRMQFKLNFQDIRTSCGSGARSLLGGSEMLANATASWIPGVCDDKSVSLGYTRLGDEVARNQYAAGTSDAVLTTQPLAADQKTVAVPLALTAPVIAFTLDYQPVCTDETVDLTTVRTDAAAVACGYTDLDDLKANLARAGQPVRDIRLDARLVAKLLTMSYQGSILGCQGGPCGFLVNVIHTLPAWAAERPVDLAADPEFQALNPQLHLSVSSNLSDAVLEASRSDAAAQIWQWLLADPDSASFLSGCPDAQGVTINPFFSSRTYTGCASTAAALQAQSAVDRAATTTPSTFVDEPLSYPPEGTPYPFPQWQQAAATASQGSLTLVDYRPRVDNMTVAARDAFQGYQPTNSVWCPTVTDSSCQPSPGKYVDPKVRQVVGHRSVIAITDTPSAARYQLTTASLCDDTGADCVQADTASLQAAAQAFVPSPVPGFVQPAATPDYAGGAYPLAMPVYAAIRPSLSTAVRTAYANAFAYITSDGQVPGYEQGALPPGYAPITSDLTSDATAAIADLRTASPTPSTSPTAHVSATPTTSASPSTSATTSTTSGGGSGGARGGGHGAGRSPSAGPTTAAPSGGVSPAATVETTPVAAGTESWPGWVLPLGVGLAMGAGMAGPFLRRRSNVTLR